MPRRTRATVAMLRERPQADVLVVGGGINGVAIMRDLALQGVDVALVEAADYGSGASSASSHMIHGGVRYLENGELRLVKESVTERNDLLRTAPHLVKPLPTVIPVFSTFSGILAAPLRLLRHGSSRPKERGALLIKVGLLIYDSFSRGGNAVPRHTFVRGQRARATRPQLPADLKYLATYYDASVHEPERLVWDVLSDGLAGGSSARAANYVSLVGASAGGGAVLRDELTGETFDFAARVVVNVTGPWTDLTNDALGTPTTLMGGTKGSHIILDNPELLAATQGNEVFFENSDGRIVLIYPLRDRVMVGTTDIEADPRVPTRCTPQEVAYFFGLVAKVFPGIPVDESQIVYRFSGIRPLPRHGDLEPGFISRDYRVVPGRLGEVPLLSVVGGKLTTFRALGEHVANDVLPVLGMGRAVKTRGRPFGGGVGFPRVPEATEAWVAAHAEVVGAERARVLLDRYGTTAARYLATVSEPEQPLQYAAGLSREEIAWIVRTQHVVRLLDLVQRRTSLAMSGRLTMPLLEELAELAGARLGWTEGERAAELEHATSVLCERHGLDLAAARPVRG